MTFLRYVLHEHVKSFEAKGWRSLGVMLNHHGHYSTLMQWEGQGEPS